MKYLISIYLWAAALISFSLFVFIGFIFTFLFPQKTYDPWFKALLRVFFKILHIKVIVAGNNNLDPKSTYLFMSNHVSLFDLPLLGGYIPVFFRGVEAHNQFSWFFYGWFIRRYGNIPINRSNIRCSIASIRQAEKFLQDGNSIAIMPEGHRTLDGKMGRFKKLPFFLAKQAGVDIVPIGLSGLFELKRKGSWLIRPTTVNIKFGAIIPAKKVKSLSNQELLDLTRCAIQSLIERS